MLNPSLTTYCDSLSRILLSSEVTAGSGDSLSPTIGIERGVDMLITAGRTGKIMLIGNGGSAAIVSHMHNDLCKAAGLRAIVFNEAPLLTALSNDDGYIHAFEKLVHLWATSRDLLLAVSSSGRSQNILRAVKMATLVRCPVITLSGFDADNPLRRLGDLNFYVPASAYGQVEVSHMALAHFLSDLVVENTVEYGVMTAEQTDTAVFVGEQK